MALPELAPIDSGIIINSLSTYSPLELQTVNRMPVSCIVHCLYLGQLEVNTHLVKTIPLSDSKSGFMYTDL